MNCCMALSLNRGRFKETCSRPLPCLHRQNGSMRRSVCMNHKCAAPGALPSDPLSGTDRNQSVQAELS
ncbi:hypothetical protein CO656_08415 [Sinorhizobium sp. FG01]|nr:hypothetical protein CO656_08415 [Sinorhizobium sp. FG01]